MYDNSLYSKELMRNCRKEADNISGKELCGVLRNIFRSCETLLEDEGQHFEILPYRRGRTDAKFLADASSVCGKAPLTAALLRDTVMRPLHIPLSYGQVGIPQQ
jgi:hypothetical protein